jgi:hypothetical protein
MCGHRIDALGTLLHPQIAAAIISLPKFSACQQRMLVRHARQEIPVAKSPPKWGYA